MKYLLDVNALIAPAVADHAFNQRVLHWADRVQREPDAALLTCSISQLGLIRVLTQGPADVCLLAAGALFLFSPARPSIMST